jgi:shikimate kinase
MSHEAFAEDSADFNEPQDEEPDFAGQTSSEHAQNLVLIGFMGTGKSHVGRMCAKQLKYRFQDSDRAIEKRVGCTVAEFFETRGEAAFREYECEVIAELAAASRLVIATGGGAILNPRNVANLRATGTVVLLTATPDALVQRLGRRQSRPLLADAEDVRARIVGMLETRAPFYEAAAHHIVDTTDRAPEQVCAEVLRVFQAQ